jgi:hypothetical protein
MFAFLSCDESGPKNVFPIIKNETCKVEKTKTGYTLTCGKADPITITNGKDGKDGEDAIIETIYLCGNTDGEILLRLSDGTIIAYSKDCLGIKEYLTILDPGNYISSDGHNCKFTLNPDGTITYN